MQISAINGISMTNAYSKLSEAKNRYYTPVNLNYKDTFTKSVNKAASLPIFEEKGKTINVVSFGTYPLNLLYHLHLYLPILQL